KSEQKRLGQTTKKRRTRRVVWSRSFLALFVLFVSSWFANVRMNASAKTSPAMKQQPIACDRLAEAYAKARAHLLSQRTPGGFWTGDLASSSLSTATAVCALTLVDRRRYAALIDGGVRWLLERQADDGGWGDTVKSFSNISTTMLCRAALTLGKEEGAAPPDQI